MATATPTEIATLRAEATALTPPEGQPPLPACARRNDLRAHVERVAAKGRADG